MRSTSTAQTPTHIARQCLCHRVHGRLDGLFGQMSISWLETEPIREADLASVERWALIAVEQIKSREVRTGVRSDNFVDGARLRVARHDDGEIALDERQRLDIPDLGGRVES